MKITNNNFWIWGQQPGCHHGVSSYNLPGENRMDSAEGGKFFGIPNCCRVVMLDLPVPPFDEEAEKLKGFKQVVWSAIGAGGVTRNNNDQSDLDEVLRQAEIHNNITGAVLDDFFPDLADYDVSRKRARHTISSIVHMRERLHKFPSRKLDLWVVMYDHQLDYEIADYLELCDVVTFWTWRGENLDHLNRNLERFVKKTPAKRRLAGCYLWDYGEGKPLSLEQMQYQLDRYQDWIERDALEGIIFCSNCIADIGLETAEMARKWIQRFEWEVR